MKIRMLEIFALPRTSKLLPLLVQIFSAVTYFHPFKGYYYNVTVETISVK